MGNGKAARKNTAGKIPARRSEKQEFRKGEKGVVFCGECGATYFMKSWRHSLEKYRSLPKDAPVKFGLCPACEMVKNHQFEGKIVVKNVPEKEAKDLMGLIENFGERAYERDVLDRVIDVKRTKSGKGSEIVVTTTENQLANKLADKIRSTFKKAQAKRSFSSSPGDVEYVEIEFPG